MITIMLFSATFKNILVILMWSRFKIR